MAIQIYNTLTRRKEKFEPLKDKQVRMYVCGPTVYAEAHVGHAMSSLVFDIIRRYLEYRGYQVIHVMNYTDVDDKIIQRALLEEVPAIELAERYIQEYRTHLVELNVLKPTFTPQATHEIDQIIEMVQGLINKNYAYPSDGDVYFRVERDDDYGKLSGRQIEDMQAGTRVAVDERKVHPMDFTLWKAAKTGEPAWDSPWGKGRPGWHIECSAMSLHHLGEQIDIHGGGNDLIFPHHENEIAQTESYTGKSFAKYWVHNGMLQLSGEKMSKSIGNLITIKEFLEENEPDVLRLMVLNASYRSPLTFNQDVITQTEKALQRLRSGLRPAVAQESSAPKEILQNLNEQIVKTKDGFIAAMDDDINSAGALGHLFDLVRVINQSRDAGASAEDLQPAQDMLIELSSVLGLQLEITKQPPGQIDTLVELLIDVRTELRQQKLWELSDMIRDRLAEQDILLEDNKDGTTWRWK